MAWFVPSRRRGCEVGAPDIFSGTGTGTGSPCDWLAQIGTRIHKTFVIGENFKGLRPQPDQGPGPSL